MISNEKAQDLVMKLTDQNIAEVIKKITAEKILANDQKLLEKAKNLSERELAEFVRTELKAPEKGIQIAAAQYEKKLKEYAVIKRIAEIENIPEETAKEYLLDIETIVCTIALKKILNRP